MNELIKRVLPVRARLAPQNRPRLAFARRAVALDGFAVGFHVALRRVGGEGNGACTDRTGESHASVRRKKNRFVP